MHGLPVALDVPVVPAVPALRRVCVKIASSAGQGCGNAGL
jgi:hypothetical protein